MPELPEVEMTARRLDAALRGAEVESAVAPGMNTMKTYDPPLDAIAGARIEAVRRIGKMPAVDFATVDGTAISMLIHLMSAGRLQVFEKRSSLRDRSARILIRLTDGREMRLREFGTRQRAWAKLLATSEVAEDEAVTKLGPAACPPPSMEMFTELVRQPHHLHSLLRNQREINGIGRSWVDEILWEAQLSPFRNGADLSDREVGSLHASLAVLGKAIEHYETAVGERVPDKFPMPLQVHRREGDPCPRCGAMIEAVYFSDYQINYCPTDQTGGKILKDRRLSKLLK